MLKRYMVLLLAVLLWISPVLAEGMLPFDDYAAGLPVPAEAEWQDEGLVRVLSLEDGTTISVCLDGGDVAAVTVEALKGEGFCVSARGMLEAAGLFSEESLEQAWQIAVNSSAVLDGVVVYHLAGEMREAYAFCAEEALEEMVWQPVHGGSKLHNSPICSGMDTARMVTSEAARALDYEPCDKCASGGAE